MAEHLLISYNFSKSFAGSLNVIAMITKVMIGIMSLLQVASAIILMLPGQTMGWSTEAVTRFYGYDDIAAIFAFLHMPTAIIVLTLLVHASLGGWSFKQDHPTLYAIYLTPLLMGGWLMTLISLLLLIIIIAFEHHYPIPQE